MLSDRFTISPWLFVGKQEEMLTPVTYKLIAATRKNERWWHVRRRSRPAFPPSPEATSCTQCVLQVRLAEHSQSLWCPNCLLSISFSHPSPLAGDSKQPSYTQKHFEARGILIRWVIHPLRLCSHVRFQVLCAQRKLFARKTPRRISLDLEKSSLSALYSNSAILNAH